MPRAASRPLPRRSCRTLGPVSCAATYAALVNARSAFLRFSNAMNTSKRPCRFMRSVVRASLNTRRFLGRPSVGGRLTAGALRRNSQGTAILNAQASVQAGCAVQVGMRVGVAELARRRSAKQTHAMKCPSSLAAFEPKQFAFVAASSAAFKPCLPAPNLSVERPC